MKKVFTILYTIILSIGYGQEGARGAIGNGEETSQEGNKYAVIIGISDYTEESLKLNYADNDAALFKNYLSEIENVPEENIELLINEKAVALNIENAFRTLAKKVAKNDIVYIYFAGHGDVVDDFGQKEGFLLAADSNANREYIGTGGVIPLERLNNRIIRALTQKSTNVILILDACRSGFIFEEGPQKNLGTLQAMFENTSKFLSCGANELSYESSDLQHGYFTHYLVKGLTGEADINKDDQLQYREIDDYLYDKVTNTVNKKHNQNQTPVVRTKDARATLKKIDKNTSLVTFEDFKKTIDKTKLIASRTISETNASLPVAVTKFADAIKRTSYYGKSSSAYEIYKKAKTDGDIKTSYLEKMKSILISRLSLSAQQLINTYISGIKKLPSSVIFQQEAKHLEICLELMDEDNLLKDRIEVSKLMLEGYSIVRNKKASRYGLAKRKFKKALSIEPRAAFVHNAMGIIYNYEKTYDSAYYHFNIAKKLINTWSEPLINLGDNLIDQYKYDQAKDVFNEAIGTNGNSVINTLRLGDINLNQGKYHIATKLYKEVLKVDKTNTEALQKLSRIETLKGNKNAAAEWYLKISEIENVDILRYIEFNKLDDKTAEQLLLNEIESQPELSEVYSNYANYLSVNNSKLKRLKLADSLYNTAITLDTKNINAFVGRAWLYFKLNRKLKSKQCFEQAIKDNINNSEIYFEYGYFLENTFKDYKAAIKNYLIAIDKNKSNISAYTNLVNLYNKEKETSKSIALLTKLTSQQPDVPEFWNLLGKTYFVNAKYNDAIDSYKKAIEIDDSYSKIHSNIGYSALEANNLNYAKEHFSIASSQNREEDKMNEVSAYIRNSAKNKLSFGTPNEAIELYKLAFEIQPNFINGYEYSKCLYLLGQTQKAIEVGETLADKIKTKADKINIITLLIKATIDANEVKKCDAYFNGLLALKTKNTDYLLLAVYSSFKNDLNAYNNFMSRVNPHLIKDNKLKGDYSKSTILKYILRN